MTPSERREFWSRLDIRLAALGNRIGLGAARALIAARVPPPTKAEIDILDLERYAHAWQGIANFFEPHEGYRETPFEQAVHEMSAAVKAKEYGDAAARVAKAKERIERVRKGEDAGLRQPFDPNNPAYLAAVRNMGRVVRKLSLIDDDRLREIASNEAIADQAKAGEERRLGGMPSARSAAKPPARAGAATTNSSNSNATTAASTVTAEGRPSSRGLQKPRSSVLNWPPRASAWAGWRAIRTVDLEA